MSAQNGQQGTGPNDGVFMSAEDLRGYADKIDMARASKASQGMKTAEDARSELMSRLSKPMPVTDEIRNRVLSQLKQAAVDGRSELMVLQFPVELCTDNGRAINNNDSDWPETLTGVPRQAYEIWRDKLKAAGYRLSAMIVEWPHGMPGDVGFFLSWGEERKY
ncbi:hypothetical protein QO002_004457 [Pararhizobium capsulatum DSM 1112]|uniref:Uncharacterized protein n=1 Tax=Pararhizobium capsulatum DSM 1112 TaxID=1121113 RepID=A0ABU0BX79_9HYPH|nr:hypothetical protein [Pararhizobium capsulatum]MDQ0322251.1 hypothetical protein [Pararhizobium capsulatum DSM 1112]